MSKPNETPGLSEIVDADGFCTNLFLWAEGVIPEGASEDDCTVAESAWWIDRLVKLCHGRAREKGFWEDAPNDGEKLALVMCEVAEAVEALRDGTRFSEKLPQHSELAEELADVVIRVLDFAGSKGIDLGTVIGDKLEYNRGRPHKHGRKF